MKTIGNILWGLVLVAIGVIVGCNALGLTKIDIFFDGWWTLFIIVPCFIGLFTESKKTGNIIGLLIGIALLLCARNILAFDFVWKLILPIILVIIGLSFIFKDVFARKINKEIKIINERGKSDSEHYATFAGQEIKYDEEEFKGTTLNAIFGGIKLDLRKAIIKKDQVINATTIFGGIDILVPEDVKVEVKSSCMFGGVVDKRKNHVDDAKAKTIYVVASCLFGGVDIK